MSSPLMMTWRRELRWWLGVHLFGWLFWLVQEEMTNETARAFAQLSESLAAGNAPEFDTVRMKKAR